MHTGDNAVERAQRFPGGLLALDIETAGLRDVFTIRCVTAAWHHGDKTHSVLLDPCRAEHHDAVVRELVGRADSVVLHNCFAGDTDVMTRDGVRRFDDIAGETVEVWSAGSWRKAEARCYGSAPVRTVRMVPARYRTNVEHSVDATGNHRWPLVGGRLVTTDDLQIGDRVIAARPSPDIDHNSDAFKHGLIFADGALYTNQPVADGVWGFQLRLCGSKARWAHLFDGVTYPPSANGDPVVRGRLPFNPKRLPDNADAQYIANFVEGWQLMDGSDFGRGRSLSSVRKQDIDWLMRHAATAGWYATGRGSRTQKGGYKPGTVSHNVVLSRGDGVKPVEWRVTHVGPPSDPVPVYCVVVPGVERFTLASGIYTGNSPFDIPPLYHHGLLSLDDIGKVVDTLLLAQLAWPDPFIRKSLSVLATEHLGLQDHAGGMATAFKAAGFKTQQDGYERMDIDSPIYRMGAMADTIATLRLEPIIRSAARSWLSTGHPFIDFGATTTAGADEVIARIERVHRVMLRRSAVGIAVDTDYLGRYTDQVHMDRTRYESALAAVGLQGGAGKGAALVSYLDSRGALPDGWPRTPTGKLKATKADLEGLDHPLAHAQRGLANTDKVLGYLDKVERQAIVTGRCHPQVGVLGASATGRWSVSTPEYQQFPADARPIFVSDGAGLWSIDWSQIEPVVLGNMAGGTDSIITSYEAGDDLYEPLMRAAGINRNLAKVCLLASLYGQGVRSLAGRIGHSEESASQIRRQLFAAMPASERFMSKVQTVAADAGRVVTLGSRILPADENSAYRAVNHCVQGSAADQLDWAVDEIDRAGLGHHIVMGLHDELVVDCDEATSVEIERIMQQPHPNMTTWAGGRTPVLRTDRESLSRAWAKC
jgi:DNA polymerase-1